jgi:secreted PhoX family phosphatase
MSDRISAEQDDHGFGSVLSKRFARRSILSGLTKMIPAAAFAAGVKSVDAADVSRSSSPAEEAVPREAAKDFRLQFSPIGPSKEDFVTVAAGYKVGVLLKWGDGLFADSPQFNPESQTPEAQSKQFGYNNDWMGYFPLPAYDTANPRHALLAVNHEYTNAELMFKNYQGIAAHTAEQTAIEMNAHGLSVVEIMRDSYGEWGYVQGSQYNRRITAATPFDVTGPAAGSAWLKTSADPTGRRVIGTINNCSGGQTPWGTVLSGEENFHGYFSNGSAVPAGAIKTSHDRYGLPNGQGEYAWAKHVDRYDLAKEPNEPFRFGWVVEIDPYDPTSVPKKRTALGRVRHEACTIQVAKNGRIVAYTGDDQRFEFVYKYVSTGTYNPFDRKANDALLDEGVLYVAKFNDDGTGQWLPLVQGQGALTPANGYATQADVLVNARLAATAVGATPMDRPEDIEPNPVNGKVYIALTNNTARTDRQIDKPNPRANNRWGHIIELTEADGDHTATAFTWEIFMLCGDGNNPDHKAFFAGYDPKKVSSIAAPDNIAFDSKGNLWIATDGQGGGLNSINDSICAVPTDGPERGFNRRLMNGVVGAETSSLVFNSDDTALFVGIQHPGEGGKWTDNPADSLSQFPNGIPSKPGILTISKAEGNPIVGT